VCTSGGYDELRPLVNGLHDGGEGEERGVAERWVVAGGRRERKSG
jgi:hypothetical protein